MWRSALALGAVSSSLACGGGPTSPSTPLIGAWGGDHISLTVTGAGNTMELTVELTDTEEVIGTFTLVRDTPGRVVKCLLPSSQQNNRAG